MSKVSYLIEYAGLQLQIAKNEHGEDVTPLKPISDLFGLSWADQKKKIGANSAPCDGDIPIAGAGKDTKNCPTGGDIPPGSSYFSRRFGVCSLHFIAADGKKREQICILFSRVASFLMSINPDKVRAQGNVSGADFLEAKITEWDDALHDYEELGIAINQNHAKLQESLRKQRASFGQMLAVKNKTPEINDRRAVSHILKQMADELRVPYQVDLLDT